MYIDSHAHIQISQFNSDREAVIKRAAEANVSNILIIGFDLESSENAVNLAGKYENLYATIGMHPHDAKDLTPDILNTFRTLLNHSKVIALGEIGLDYYRNLFPHQVQKDAFNAQLDLAEETGLPIIVHNRDAYMDILPILEARHGNISGVLHCFTGDIEMMRRSVELGFYIGIGGIVTYPNAKDVQSVVKELPFERLLIETDCPWLTPQFRRGKRNEPAYVLAVAEKIAELRDTSVEEIGRITTNNFNNLFGTDL